MGKKKIEVEKFKELILDMYRGFPNYRFYGMVEAVIKTEEDRNRLIKHGFLIKEKTGKGDQYGLGPNSLPLVSAWKTEQLTKQINYLTWAILFLSIVILVVTIVGILKWKKLGEVCEFVRGPFGGSLKKDIFKPEGYAVYEQQHAIYDQFEDIRYFIDEKKFNEMKRFELKSGDLIMSCSGTMGKMA